MPASCQLRDDPCRENISEMPCCSLLFEPTIRVRVLLPYSRFHESEADSIGLDYAAKAGFDPREAPAFWQRMSSTGGQPPEFLSTHPNPGSRIKALESQMSEAMAIYEKSQKSPTVAL